MTSDWIDVKDQLPGPGIRVLVTGRSKSPFGYFVGVQIYFGRCMFDHMGKRRWETADRPFHGEDVVTHWMPLPDLPR